MKATEGPTIFGEDIDEIRWWQRQNFGAGRGEPGARSAVVPIGGLTEEVGELARAVVKLEQGIRGTEAEWLAEMKKEGGDVFIKLVDVLDFYGIDVLEAIYERWQTIKGRNWIANKQGHGLPEDDA